MLAISPAAAVRCVRSLRRLGVLIVLQKPVSVFVVVVPRSALPYAVGRGVTPTLSSVFDALVSATAPVRAPGYRVPLPKVKASSLPRIHTPDASESPAELYETRFAAIAQARAAGSATTRSAGPLYPLAVYRPKHWQTAVSCFIHALVNRGLCLHEGVGSISSSWCWQHCCMPNTECGREAALHAAHPPRSA